MRVSKSAIELPLRLHAGTAVIVQQIVERDAVVPMISSRGSGYRGNRQTAINQFTAEIIEIQNLAHPATSQDKGTSKTAWQSFICGARTLRAILNMPGETGFLTSPEQEPEPSSSEEQRRGPQA